jgi:NAD+ synthase (glutamine-hydrolysing)
MDRPPSPLKRFVDAHPFVPSDPATLSDRCREIFSIQVAGLAKRLELIGQPVVSIGVSGGLDSTLALLVLIKTADLIGLPRSRIHGFTLPGFGTTNFTLKNARELMRGFGITSREIDIRSICIEQMKGLGHRPFGMSLEGETPDTLTAKLRALPNDKRHDLTFENVQARVRTSYLMNAGFQIGTGDMSELALGWCTYNADHMSMYNVNVSVPKTLVRCLVRWAADHEFDGEIRTLLHDVANTVISPELLPTTEKGEIAQATEDTVGPYELHDFFLYHFIRYGTAPDKILHLAGQAKFDRPYGVDEMRKWLIVFLKRFFQNQFKRSCVPDGPKVGSVSLSPRGDWRMPSDAVAGEWLRRLDGDASETN